MPVQYFIKLKLTRDIPFSHQHVLLKRIASSVGSLQYSRTTCTTILRWYKDSSPETLQTDRSFPPGMLPNQNPSQIRHIMRETITITIFTMYCQIKNCSCPAPTFLLLFAQCPRALIPLGLKETETTPTQATKTFASCVRPCLRWLSLLNSRYIRRQQNFRKKKTSLSRRHIPFACSLAK